MSVLPIRNPSAVRWSLAPRPRAGVDIAEPTTTPVEPTTWTEGISADFEPDDDWVRLPLPMPLFVAATAVGSLAAILSGVGILLLR